MIIGIGTDLVDQRRIKNLLDQYGNRFKNKVFSKTEQEYADSQVTPYRAYANRFAAKEACVKALGTGFSQGITLRDIEVNHDEGKKPCIALYNQALIRFHKLIPGEKQGIIHVSLTDEEPYSQAFVIISRE